MTRILIIVAIAALVLLFLFGRWFANAEPAQIRRWLMRLGLLAIALPLGYLALRGGPAGILALLGAAGFLIARKLTARRGPKSGEQPGIGISTFSSRHVRLTLDHRTHALSGNILEGQHQGQSLGDLSQGELLALLEEYSRNDPASAALLEQYLNHRFGTSFHERATSGAAPAGPMTRDEAYAILGLPPQAGTDEIRAAHRRLMQKIHPDRGGSDYLAAKINQAKDVLLGQ